jgi:hypothetical protein
LTARNWGENNIKSSSFMSDENELPPAPSESDDAAKAETIRITLPSKPDQPTLKRETVRINLPGKPASTGSVPLPAIVPKKETTKIPGASGIGQVPQAPPSAPKPFVPAPPRPPSQGGAPLPPPKPVSGITPPPKPPSLGSRPTVPLKPTPAPANRAAGTPETVAVSAVPKKETARITLPPEGAKGLPKATIKMQQTQPLINKTMPVAVTPSGFSPAVVASTVPAAEPANDSAVTLLSVLALVASIVSALLVFMAYNASSAS